MAALKLDMAIPLGEAGRVCLAIDVADLDALTADQRQGLADTSREFAEFAAGTLAPPPGPPEAKVHDPSAAVLDGVRGSRIRDKL
jgi:hypothetical protein